MNYRLFLLLLLLPALAGAAELLPVAHVINGKSLQLAGGDIVRLAGIEAPNVQEETGLKRGGEPLGDEAKRALAGLAQGKKIRIDYNPGIRDRHNRLLGQLYREDGMWLQGEMLRGGYALVYSFTDDSHAVIMKMLALEREAEKAKRGIWADAYWRVIKPEETKEFIGRFKLVEGKVQSVHEYHGHIYVNFSEHWKGNFAVFISRKFADKFGDLQKLVGKTVRVRGWINYHNAPMIDLSHPEQIEVL